MQTKNHATAFVQSDTRLLEIEIRDLKATILALRDALENEKNRREEAIQAVIAGNHNEITQLKETIFALRETLEAERRDKNRSIQEAVANSHNETLQLKAMISSLRDAMEAMPSAK